MTDRQFLKLDSNHALAHDDRQWVLQRRGSFNRQRQKYNWSAIAYIATRRDILLRCIRENGIVPSVEAKKVLAKIPGTFTEWMDTRKRDGLRFEGCSVALNDPEASRTPNAA